jgi:hypothetical protein
MHSFSNFSCESSPATLIQIHIAQWEIQSRPYWQMFSTTRSTTKTLGITWLCCEGSRVPDSLAFSLCRWLSRGAILPSQSRKSHWNILEPLPYDWRQGYVPWDGDLTCPSKRGCHRIPISVETAKPSYRGGNAQLQLLSSDDGLSGRPEGSNIWILRTSTAIDGIFPKDIDGWFGKTSQDNSQDCLLLSICSVMSFCCECDLNII